MGRLAASVAHEINNPLEAVTNLILPRENGEFFPRGPTLFWPLRKSRWHPFPISPERTYLRFYRETKGARPVQPSELVKSLLVVYVARARNKGIEIRQEIKSDASINAVPGEVRQIIANLITNSIDAIHGPGRIVIRVSSAREWKNGSAGIPHHRGRHWRRSSA